MSQLVALDTRAKDITRLFATNHKRMLSGIPTSIAGRDPNRLISIAYNSIAYNTDLLLCTQASLIGGVFEALKLGLLIGGPMQECWLIPFNTKAGKCATLIIGYQGYRNIIDRGRAVLDLQPRAVHIGDEFDYWFGDQPRIIHKPKRPTPENREHLRAVYCVANLRGGGRQFEVLEVEEVEAHRLKSRAKDSGPWVDFYVPMALKTAVRKLAKYVPKSSEILARALDLDDKADRGLDQTFDVEGLVVFDGSLEEPNTSKIEELKARLEARLEPWNVGKTLAPRPEAPAREVNPEYLREDGIAKTVHLDENAALDAEIVSREEGTPTP